MQRPSPRSQRLLVALAATFGSLVAGPAFASPALETLGGLDGSNALTARALANGAEATYFNPALLPGIPDGFGVGFFVVSEQLDISLNRRPAGSDISSDIYDAWVPDADGDLQPLSDRPLPTSDLAPRGAADTTEDLRSYLTIGFVKALVERRLSVGFYGVLPTSTFQSQTSRFADEREQFFSNSLQHELYGDRLGQMTMTLGLGGEITDWFSWGLGFTLGLSTTTVNPVYIPDAADQSELFITSDTAVNTTFSPHLALAFKPLEALSASLTFHAAAKSQTTGTNRIKFWKYDYEEGEDAVTQTFKFTNGYDPMSIGLGVSAVLDDDPTNTWTVGLNLQWKRWSDYLDRQTAKPEQAWDDTLTVSTGVRWTTESNTTVHMDLAWLPTPVPDQDGRSNYVDNDRLAISGGLETRFDIFGVIVDGSIGVQLHRLLPRSVTKRTTGDYAVVDEFPDDAVNIFTGDSYPDAAGLQSNNPGFPGFSSSGWLLGAGVTLKTPL